MGQLCPALTARLTCHSRAAAEAPTLAQSDAARILLGMLTRKPPILLTGFGPFPGIPHNASSLLVPLLRSAATRAFRSHNFIAEILPTEWQVAPQRVRQLLLQIEPEVALHFGVASRAKGFEIEARGRNLTDGRIDASGAHPPSQVVVEGAEPYLASNLPVGDIVKRLKGRNIPARISRSAGRYLCNAVMYHSLDVVRRSHEGMRNGFIHLPSRIGASDDPEVVYPMSLEQALDGGLEIIATCLGRQRTTPPLAPTSAPALT
jgi:pyroglutamyl-peptidase